MILDKLGTLSFYFGFICLPVQSICQWGVSWILPSNICVSLNYQMQTVKLTGGQWSTASFYPPGGCFYKDVTMGSLSIHERWQLLSLGQWQRECKFKCSKSHCAWTNQLINAVITCERLKKKWQDHCSIGIELHWCLRSFNLKCFAMFVVTALLQHV